ncbi:hypothetical protein PMAYCL1PPCAC_08533, partial [Pristionchus mayeri]
IASLHLARDASMHAENAASEETREGQMGEDLVEHLEQLDRLLAVQETLRYLGEKTVGLVDGPELVVPAEKRELKGVDVLEHEKQHDDLERLATA